jgi:cytochrome bd-type quinol oxidase subunit 1
MKLLYLIVDDHLYYSLALIWLSVVAFGLGLVVGLVCVSL